MIHPTADVSPDASIGEGTRIWHQAQVRERARIGRNCIVGKGSYVDSDVLIGDNVKIQNGVNIYHGVTIEDGVFVGPRVCFTNDMFPRAITPEGGGRPDAGGVRRLARRGRDYPAGRDDRPLRAGGGGCGGRERCASPRPRAWQSRTAGGLCLPVWAATARARAARRPTGDGLSGVRVPL